MADGKLTALGVQRLAKPGHHSDGGNLYLRVAKGGAKGWMFRYALGGKAHWMGLGGYPEVSLAQAREKARQCRDMLREGIDPLQSRKAAKNALRAAVAHNFEAVAREYIQAHRDGWKNAKHAQQWLNTLDQYAFPVIGKIPVSQVALDDVVKVLEPIWRAIPETASRLRGRIERVLDYATARGLRTGDNPARWRGALQFALPAPGKLATVEHHAALPYAELPGVFDHLCESSGMAALAVRFIALTAVRSGEARGATWGEVDLDRALWTIPAHRMKAGVEHVVPLSTPAIAILTGLRALYSADPARLIFPSPSTNKPLSDVALAKALRLAGGGEATVHGLRSAFRDWCAERTSYPREVAEAALAHGNRNKTEAAYLRTRHLEQRRRLMAAWADFVTDTAPGEVVSIGRPGA